jgi:hypothetical protein
MISIEEIKKKSLELQAKVNPKDKLVIEMAKEDRFKVLEELTKEIRRKKIPFDEKIKEIRATATTIAKAEGLIEKEIVTRKVKGGEINDYAIDTKTLKKIFTSAGKSSLLVEPPKPKPKKKKEETEEKKK